MREEHQLSRTAVEDASRFCWVSMAPPLAIEPSSDGGSTIYQTPLHAAFLKDICILVVHAPSSGQSCSVVYRNDFLPSLCLP